MSNAFNPNKRFTFVPEDQDVLPSEKRMTITFKRLDLFEEIELNEMFDDIAKHPQKYALELLRRTMTGISNGVDEDGNPVLFELDAAGLVTNQTLSALKPLFAQLFTFAVQINSVTKDQLGKS